MLNVRTFWTIGKIMDPLSDLLDMIELRGALYFRTAFTPPWSIAVPPLGRAARFHLVVQGQCWAAVDGRSVRLDPGDLVIIPNGAGHVLSDVDGAKPVSLDTVVRRSGFTGDEVLVYGGDAPGARSTQLICGHFAFAQETRHPLIEALPDLLVVTAEMRARDSWLDDIMRLIARRMFSGAPGSAASVKRLSEAMFVEAIKACAGQAQALEGVVGALNDPRISRSLALMHKRPEADWTIERIAGEIGMSRSRFAELFQAMIGRAPMGYLAEIRLQKAMTLLRRTSEPIQRIADRVGYRSPAAFTRAFAERYGMAPRDVRKSEEIMQIV